VNQLEIPFDIEDAGVWAVTPASPSSAMPASFPEMEKAGMKWMVQRGCRCSQTVTLEVLVSGKVVENGTDDLPAGGHSGETQIREARSLRIWGLGVRLLSGAPISSKT
jgi:hypothetical protein